MDKRLIYVLNHYSKKSSQHFYHIVNLLQKIAESGVLIALVIEKCDDIPEINNKNIKIITQKEKNKFMRAVELYRIISNLIKHEKYRKVFIRISSNAAIISVLAAKVHKAETYYWQSGAAFEVYRKMQFLKKIKWYSTAYVKFIFIKNNIDYFMTGPESMIEYYANEANVKRSKLNLLYNDIDTSRFTRPNIQEKINLREKLGLNKNKKYVLLVHRFSPIRKTDYYIPYIAKENNTLSSVDFILIGDGPDKELINSKIKKEGVKNVHMIGEVDNASIQEYYKACDVFINPSYTEGFPRVIIEAMASGLPIVTTDAGGTTDLFGEKQLGYVVPKENRELFRNCLIEMLENENIQIDCTKENIKKSRNFSTKKVAEMYIKTIWGK